MRLQNSATARQLVSILGAILSVTLFVSNTNSIYGLLSTSSNIGTTGVVSSASLGVYSNSACTTTLSSIDWGNISPGGTATYTVYVKNTGTVALTLAFTTASWSPTSANTYFTLTWSYTSGTSISAGAVIPITFTLSLSQSVTGITNFQFQITITGAQA